MAYRDTTTPFRKAAQPDAADLFRSPSSYKRNIAVVCQGGGAITRGGSEAMEILFPHVLEHGDINVISGTSGAALLAAIYADAMNKGHGMAGVSKGFKKLWDGVGHLDTAYGISRFHKMTKDPLVGGYFAVMETFAAAAIAHTGGPTHRNKDILERIIGDGKAMRAGPVVPYVNYLLHNALTGEDDHVVARGKDVTADKVVGSGGLDELGNHRTYEWATGKLQIMRDGAYQGGANPVIRHMIEEQRPTDVIVITLHGPADRPKSPREQKIYTTEIHAELAILKQQYKGRVNFHPLHLDFGDMDHLNADPQHLNQIAALAREQTVTQLPGFLHRFEHAPRVRPLIPAATTGPLPERHLAGVA